MAIIRKSKDSASDLILSLEEFMDLLHTEGEDEAIADLNKAKDLLKDQEVDSDHFKQALSIIADAFEGDHELNAYTFGRKDADDGNWTPADRLYMASTRVLNLVNRFNK